MIKINKGPNRVNNILMLSALFTVVLLMISDKENFHPMKMNLQLLQLLCQIMLTKILTRFFVSLLDAFFRACRILTLT